MKAENRYLISTDLDGTLLDHYSYEWQAAQPSLLRMAEQNIPVIINTSKTFEEVLALQQAINLTAPFIVENGSAAYFPLSQFPDFPESAQLNLGFWKILLGSKRSTIVETLQAIRKEHGWQFEGFSDMSLERVMALTGLPTDSAEQALNRQYSEPLVWQDSDDHYAQFVTLVGANNLRVIKGGRFIHILGLTDKGTAISWCKHYLENQQATEFKLVALGDSPNDNDMLNIADYAVQVKSPTHAYPEIANATGEIYQTQGLGPVGWHEAIRTLIP